jgi:glutathione S-transferase
MALKIYGVLRSRATRNVWLAKELGIDFTVVPVIQGYRLPDAKAAGAPLNTESPAFRAINPNGQVPCIEDDGFVLCESLAINLYLAKKHGGPLAPKDAREEALMMQWALWAATDCEPKTLAIQYARAGKPEQRDEAVVKTSIEGLARPAASLDSALAKGGGWLVGNRFTVADVNAAEVWRYAQAAPEFIDAHAPIKAWLAACQARPAFKAMMDERAAEPM